MGLPIPDHWQLQVGRSLEAYCRCFLELRIPGQQQPISHRHRAHIWRCFRNITEAARLGAGSDQRLSDQIHQFSARTIRELEMQSRIIARWGCHPVFPEGAKW